MPQQNNPTIDSGVVNAPLSTDPRYPTNTSQTQQAAPSQATASQPASSQPQFPPSDETYNPRATRKSNPMMRAGEAVAGGPVPGHHPQHGNGTGNGPVHYGQTGVSEWGNGGAPMRYDGTGTSNLRTDVGGNTNTAEAGYAGTGTTTGNGVGNSTTGTGHGAGGATTSTGYGNGNAVDNRTTSAKVKESASGVKGLAAAVHGVGETLRGEFNAGVDGLVGDVCSLSFINPFPSPSSLYLL